MFHFPIPKPLVQCNAKKPEFFLEDFLPIPKNALTLLSANGGSGKTFLAIQLGIKAAQEKNMKILLWLSEDPSSIIKWRAEELLNKLRIGTHLNNIDIIDEMPQHLNIDNYNEYDKLFKPYNIIVLDPLIAFFGGEENSNTQARYFMNMLNKMAKDNLQSFIIIHHSTKGNKEEAAKTRGAGAFIDAVRLVYEINSIENSLYRDIVVKKDNYGVKEIIKGNSKQIKVFPYEVVYEEKEKAKEEFKKSGKLSLWEAIQ